MTVPEYRFDNRPLRDWLLELVDENTDVRRDAGVALAAMQFGLTSSDEDFENVQMDLDAPEEFAAAIRAVAAEPDFPREEWIGKLVAYMRDVQQDWMTFAAEHWQQRQLEEEDEGLLHFPTDVGLSKDERAEARRYEALREMAFEQETPDLEHEALTFAHVMARTVFQALDDVLLENEKALRSMLQWAEGATEALNALARIGPEAADFVPELMERLDNPEGGLDLALAEALAAICGDDPELIHALLDRLHAPHPQVRQTAAATLGFMEPAADAEIPRITEALLKATHDEDEDVMSEAIWALGSVAAPDERIHARVYALSQHPSAWVQAASIDVLGDLAMKPEQTVPRLIDALDTFEEPDDDMEDYERVCNALMQFPPELIAAQGLPLLIDLLWDEDEYLSLDIVDLLGYLGPLAKEALPELLAAEGWLTAAADFLEDEEDIDEEEIEGLDEDVAFDWVEDDDDWIEDEEDEGEDWIEDEDEDEDVGEEAVAEEEWDEDDSLQRTRAAIARIEGWPENP